METCLQTLWELLREPIARVMEKDDNVSAIDSDLSEKHKAAMESKKLIETFFDKFEDRIGKKRREKCKPDHIQVFEDALNEFSDKSVSGVRNGAIKARDIAKSCDLCAVCRNCSSHFYDEISRQTIVEKRLPYELKDYFTELPQMHYYQANIEKNHERKYLLNSFWLLKGFSSSTPTIYSATFDSECLGGGLYINYRGKGIVIDPGIGFVNSMHKHGIYINDIHVVIITHDHYDHNADAETISSLLHDYNNYNKKKNALVKEIFELGNTVKHEIHWIVDSGTASKLKGKIAPVRKLKDYLGENRKEVLKNEKGIRLYSVNTHHIRNGECFGLKLRLLFEDGWFEFGYTSDTAFFKELPLFFHATDLLVFHVSDLYKKDVKGIKNKSSHLGYNGSIKLLQNVNAKLVIASEFCCTNGDFRMDFMKSVVDEIKKEKEILFLPGEIGLKIYLPNQEIECSICRRKVSVDKIKVIAPDKSFGEIKYACRQCAQDVLQ